MRRTAGAASLKFDEAPVWFLADPVGNAHSSKTRQWRRRLSDKDENRRQGQGRVCASVGLMEPAVSRAAGRCVHQRGFLADDACDWKWPGRRPGSTYTECCWVDTLAVRSAPTIRWLPLRFCEESETYVLDVSPYSIITTRPLIHRSQPGGPWTWNHLSWPTP